MNDTITAVPGVAAGAWTHPSGTTGVSVVTFDAPAQAGMFRAGFGVSTRQVDGLEHPHISGRIHAVCFTGGSAFGLGVADGVVAALEARGVGFPTGFAPVPLVPTAVIFDLPVAVARPDAAAGRAALEAASTAPVRCGRFGAGAGATVAKWVGQRLPGGVGSAAGKVPEGYTVGVLVVLNAAGSIRDPDTGAWLAGHAPELSAPFAAGASWDQNTTLVLVATDAGLSRDECCVLARMAGAGMARAIHPVFSPFDGDIVIAAATGGGALAAPAVLGRMGSLASDLVVRAIIRAVRPPGAGGAPA